MPDELTRWLFDPTVGRLIAAAVGVMLVLFIRGVVQRRLVTQVAGIDARYRARKMVSLAAWGLIVFVLVGVFSDRLGSFAVAFGVAGAGVAFALQEVIASVAGWIAITLGHAFRIGDRIKLGETLGDVIDIGMLRTTLMECGGWIDGDNYNGRIVTVANSFLFKGPLINYTGDFPFLWDEIVVPIRHGSSLENTRNMLQSTAADLLSEYARGASEQWSEMVSRYRIEDARVKPMVMMRADENWMTFTLRYVVDYRSRRTTKDQLWREIIDQIGRRSDVHLACSSLEVSVDPASGNLPVTVSQP